MVQWDTHADLVVSTIATAPSPATSGTSCILAAGTGTLFPSGSYDITMWPDTDPAPLPGRAEVARVVNRASTSDTLSGITRGSPARTVATGWNVALTIAAKVLQDVESQVDATNQSISDSVTGLESEMQQQDTITLLQAQAYTDQQIAAGGGGGGSGTALTTDAADVPITVQNGVAVLDTSALARVGQTPDRVDTALFSALPANTYANGVNGDGVGANLSANANGAFPTVGSEVAALGTSYVILAEATAAHNGIYTLAQVGDVSTPWALIRDERFDEPSELRQGRLFAVSDALFPGMSLVLAADVNTVGTDPFVVRNPNLTPGMFPLQLFGQPVLALSDPTSTTVDAFVQRNGPGVVGLANAIDLAGLTGATSAARFVGHTVSGPPTTGTFVTSDIIIDQGGNVWVCAAGGSPGTWKAGFSLFARLSSTITGLVNNSTTLVNVTGLSVTVQVNATYRLWLRLIYDCATAADLKVGWTFPAGLTMSWNGGFNTSASSQSPNLINTTTAIQTGTSASGGVGTGVGVVAEWNGIVINGSTAGTLQLQAAQNAADATNLNIGSNSCLLLQRIA